jgi:hypothetical protein
MLLSAFDNCALDGGREAVLENFEVEARRRRTDAVNARLDAIERFFSERSSRRFEAAARL